MAEPGKRALPELPARILKWWELLERQGAKHGVDPFLLAALVTQESGGDPDAYSKSGAVGLMQVMPRDGLAASFQCVNGPCFASRPSMEALFNPRFNVRYGTAMLAGLIAEHGNEREALFRYGPMDVGYTYADKVLAIYSSYRSRNE